MPAPFGGTLSATEERYAKAARAANTRRGYRSDWADFTAWATAAGVAPLPADPETVNAYLFAVLDAGAKVSTLSRRLSSIAAAHELAGHPSPTADPRVRVVWEGVRRTHGRAPDKAPPLMPPVLWDVLEHLPATPAGHRDAAILLVGFVGALRRSELATASVEDLADHERGMVLTIPTSKTDQHHAGQVVVLPRASRPGRCPVTTLQRWLDVAGITEGPLWRRIHRSGAIQPVGMTAAAINDAVQRACTAALGPDHGYSAHSLRSGFATYAAARGASDRSIAHQTRHRSLASVGPYVQHHTAWVDNAATALDL